MLIDLHMHEATFSADSRLSLEEIVTTARRLGLDGVCITDHDSMGLRETAERYSRKTGFPIFVGVEYYSLQGDMVAYGIDSLPGRRISAQDFVDFVHRQGGVCYSAHPFRDNNRGLEDHLLAVRGLDAIEAFNGSTAFQDNMKALEVCKRLGIQPVGASDCHVREKIGVFATRMPGDVFTMEAFVHAFRKGLCSPVCYYEGRYVDIGQVPYGFATERHVIPITA